MHYEAYENYKLGEFYIFIIIYLERRFSDFQVSCELLEVGENVTGGICHDVHACEWPFLEAEGTLSFFFMFDIE